MISYKSAVCFLPGDDNRKNNENYYFNSKIITAEYDGSRIRLAQKVEKDGLQVFGVFSGTNSEVFENRASFVAAGCLKKYHALLLKDEAADADLMMREYCKEASFAVSAKGFDIKGNKASVAAVILNDSSVKVVGLGEAKVFHGRNNSVKTVYSNIDKDGSSKNIGYLGGAADSVVPAINDVKVGGDEVFVLCGNVSENITEDGINSILMKLSEPAEIAAEIAALCDDGREDCTVLVIKSYGEPLVIAPVVEEVVAPVVEEVLPEVVLAADTDGFVEETVADEVENIRISEEPTAEEQSAKELPVVEAPTVEETEQDEEEETEQADIEPQPVEHTYMGLFDDLLEDEQSENSEKVEDATAEFEEDDEELPVETIHFDPDDIEPVEGEVLDDVVQPEEIPVLEEDADDEGEDIDVFPVVDVSESLDDGDAEDDFLFDGNDEFDGIGIVKSKAKNKGVASAAKRFAGGEEGAKEPIWPALVIFTVCLIFVILLCVFAVEMIKVGTAPENPSGNIQDVTPTPEDEEGTPVADPTETATGGNTATPSTDAPATNAPEEDATATPKPDDDEPEQTEAPADPTDDVTDTPTEAPTDAATEAPSDDPTEAPTDDVTDTPTEAPTGDATEPAETPTADPNPEQSESADPTEEATPVVSESTAEVV